LLTDAVIGTWTSALLLDVLGGDRDGDATERLIALGLAAYAPTAASGALDWADSEAVDDGVRRIGTVHALANGAAAALQTASLARRRRGDRRGGVALSLAGAAALGAGGYLGAHLSFARGVGVDQTAFDGGPADWTAAADAADLRDGEPLAVHAGDTPVLLVRAAGRIRAIHDRCSHRGCSLAAGSIDGDVVECSCHGSRFRLDDGGIERGPASSPQPAFDVRERDGRIEVRARSAP
jgi:nitrite reductase/ring-hydroxylating ferredoxin subunit